MSTTTDEPTVTDETADATASNVIELRPRKGDDGGMTITPVQRTDEEAVFEAPAAPLEHQLEALLFVSPTPLTVERLAEATDEDPDDLNDCLVDMMQRYSEDTSGIVLERVAGGWAFRANDRTRVQLGKLLRPQADTKLSPSALETLAIVAYLQPISRPDVARIRGVSVDAAMSGLLERGFVEEAGRGESGAVMFRTTALFERAFGLSSINALPELEGFGPSDDERIRLREQLEQIASARVD
jgi:segregation and condensation protein B